MSRGGGYRLQATMRIQDRAPLVDFPPETQLSSFLDSAVIRMRRSISLLALAAAAGCASTSATSAAGHAALSSGSRAQFSSGVLAAQPDASPPGVPPELQAIKQSDLQRDLYYLASDSMKGRRSGTLDELRASAWIADQARAAGLAPAGDNGTYFQFWPLRRIRTSGRSRVLLDGAPLVLWQDASVVAPVEANEELPLVWIGTASADSIAHLDLRGKAVAAELLVPSRPPVSWISLRMRRYTSSALAERTAALQRAGAAAAVLVSDDSTDGEFIRSSAYQRLGSYADDSTGRGAPPARMPVVWVRRAQLQRVAEARRLTLDLAAESYSYPSVNVVAVVRGTDPARRGQYVVYSGHQDHDGVLFTDAAGDSIWNGADDNASVSVAMLAIGRATARHPMPRSALFVWQGAEERGLLGSRWFVAHPTVPRDSMVAVINGDMIGRNNPDSAALLGVQPPHLNSHALVAAAYAANAEVGHFVIDTSWDNPRHPEGWYFRSDHLSYARAGIPAIFFTTLLHPDYHTERDEAARIDYGKLTRMTRWMYATGWIIGTADARPDVVPGFRLER